MDTQVMPGDRVMKLKEKLFQSKVKFVNKKRPKSGPLGTVPELLFEKKGLIPAIQQLLVSH